MSLPNYCGLRALHPALMNLPSWVGTTQKSPRPCSRALVHLLATLAYLRLLHYCTIVQLSHQSQPSKPFILVTSIRFHRRKIFQWRRIYGGHDHKDTNFAETLPAIEDCILRWAIFPVFQPITCIHHLSLAASKRFWGCQCLSCCPRKLTIRNKEYHQVRVISTGDSTCALRYLHFMAWERGYKRSVTHDIGFPFSGIRKSTLRIRPEDILFGSPLAFGAVPCPFFFRHALSTRDLSYHPRFWISRTAVSIQIARRAPNCSRFHGINVTALFVRLINRYPSEIPDCIRLLKVFLNVTQP